MNQTTRVRLFSGLMAAACLLLLAACGGGSGDGTQALKGQIQILNNMATHIERLEMGPAGDPAPKVDRLGGVLPSGSSFTIDADGGVYDLDVWIFDLPFGYKRFHPGVVVTPGAITTIVVAP